MLFIYFFGAFFRLSLVLFPRNRARQRRRRVLAGSNFVLNPCDSMHPVRAGEKEAVHNKETRLQLEPRMNNRRTWRREQEEYYHKKKRKL